MRKGVNGVDDVRLLELLDTSPADGMEMLKSLYGEPVRLAAVQQLSCAKDVQACVQDTFADFYAQRKRFDPAKGSLRGYLITISTRKAIRLWRSGQQQLPDK